MEAQLSRRLLAEAVGTGILVVFGAGSVVAAERLPGRFDYPDLGFIALAFGLSIAIAVYAFGTTSGAHINPAVTVALAVARRFPWSEVVSYVGAQAAGAVVGALLLVAVFGSTAVDTTSVGSTEVSAGVSFVEAVVAEALGTFLLLTTIMALAVGRRPPAVAGLMIGLSVSSATLVIGPLTAASINPARTFGPLLVTTLYDGDTAWGDFPVYIIGPLIGGVVAAALYEYVGRPERPGPDREGTQGPVTGRRSEGISG